MAGSGHWIPDWTVEYPCPKCLADPNHDCLRPDGEPALRYHSARAALASEGNMAADEDAFLKQCLRDHERRKADQEVA